MSIEVCADADAAAREAAKLIAKETREAVATQGKFVVAVSGGKTPWIMLRDLAPEDVLWNDVHVIQVDERVAPEGDPDNLANKVPGVRAALINDHFSVRQGVEDDHVNIICLGGWVMGIMEARDRVEAFLAAEFSLAERHLRRLRKVAALEKKAVSEVGAQASAIPA
jgi:hypothetical protein